MPKEPVERTYLPDDPPWRYEGTSNTRCIKTVKHGDRAGQRCRRLPVVGSTICMVHGGANKAIRKKGRERRAKELAERELVELGHQIEGTDPTLALLGLVAEAAGNVAFLRRKVQQLEQGYVGRVYRERIAEDEDDPGEPGQGIVGPNHLGDGAPHVYLVLYADWSDRLARYSKMAIEAGIVERQVQLAERQGELIAQVIRGVLGDLGVPGTPETAAVVRKHLSLAASSVA